ncbi:putative ankyrin repeat protein [Rosellinia necatrix]|uniref:Putative ankyrin repeat protein n=1 Tax=Rosellinia necatrix TaxID=77044 RepID=A0A1S8ABJ8_ROSNE|nr:putative ankyrin repeat protein [Rosellinia necatrix]
MMASPRTSIASSQPDQRHLRIIAASAQANEARVRDILAEDPPWTSSADLDALRQALQKVAARGKLSVVRLLISHGADVNPKRDTEPPALVKAAEAGNVAVVEELLSHHADPNARNRLGQTALFVAAIKGHNKVVEKLANARADVNARDKEGRSPLLYLASEKKAKAKWTTETLRLLQQHGADTEVRDNIGRSPLLWAATNNNIELTTYLLENKADVDAVNNRGRTALHLSVESSDEEHRDDMVRLLLSHGANPEATSDGGWTPLHNAVQSGHLSTVALLLDTKARVNAELSNGMTPLHWAAYNGFGEIVKLLLTRPDVNTAVKDGFDRTPMLCAAEKHHGEIVHLLSPAQTANRLSELEERACREFEATVVDFGQFEKKQLVSKHTVYDLLYGWNNELNKPRVSTLTKNLHYQPDFRWIHLPANNVYLHSFVMPNPDIG